MTEKLCIAYVAGGGLHIKLGEEAPERLASAFGEGVLKRATQIRRRHEWKEQGRGARFMAGGLLWGTGHDPGGTPIVLTSLTSGPTPGQLLYTIDAGGVEAVCSYSLQDRLENRLRHGSKLEIRHLTADPDQQLLACSVDHGDGTAGLAVMNNDASNLREITEGDSVDLAPSWVPGGQQRMIYQSAGVGRNREGRPVELGPFLINQLDLERGDIEIRASSTDADLLGPRLRADGRLYYIRRPRQPTRSSVGRILLDIILFLPRLFYALFQYLSFFTARYTGKPLTTAGGPKKQGADMRQMMVWGNLIDAEQAAENDGDEPAAVVPRSWKLVCQAPDGTTQNLADSVLSYDLVADGSIVYSTGSAIYRLDEKGKRERLVTGKAIQQVVVLTV